MLTMSYEAYVSIGGKLDQDSFLRHAFLACKTVDRLTHGRLRGETPLREAALRAIAAIADQMAADAELGGREIAAQSNDGLSVTYAVPGGQTPGARYTALARGYLEGETAGRTALLYAGADA